MPTTTVRTDGAELIVNEAGSGEPTLIFLHYWGGSARTWTPVIERLPASVRAIAINQRGWGGSRVVDGRFGLEALADDVAAVVAALRIDRYVVVGHSMGGKVAQILALRKPHGLSGLVLVAPAPPEPMTVPEDVRAGMLASYQSRQGVVETLQVLCGATLAEAHREQVIEDTLRGAPEARRIWPEHGMTSDIGFTREELRLPLEILVGDHDRVERPSVLRPLFSRLLPHAAFTVVPNAGHLLPLEAPQALADACVRMRDAVR